MKEQTGIEYWRSLEQLADSEDVRKLIEAEFPGYDPQQIASVSRRRFMKLMGASMALAGLTLSGCRRWPKERLAPFVANYKGHVPGVSEQYATVMELDGVGHGLLVTSFDGRPVKIEGNPLHPFSRTVDERLGAADAFAQASVLELYDPDRSRFPVRRDQGQGGGKQSSWEEFENFATPYFEQIRSAKGAGLAILSEASCSPSVMDMRRRLLEVCPQARWYEYEPLSRDNELAGTKMAFGRMLRPVLHLDKAATVVLFDADLLGKHPAHLAYARDWSMRRRSADQGQMSRVFIAETQYSTTGAAADVRLPVRPSRIAALVAALAGRIGVKAGPGGELTADEARFIDAAAEQLKANKGQGLVAVGPQVSPEIQAMVHEINAAIGAAGSTVSFIEEPGGDRPTHLDMIRTLTGQMNGGQVKTLVILGGNPVYDAPADLDFAAALSKVQTSIHLSLYDNETSIRCKWHLPRAHYLESWGDARGWDGTISVQQPLIEPLFGGDSVIEFLAYLVGERISTGEQIVRRTFAEQFLKGSEDFEPAWRAVLHDGILAKSASPTFEARMTTGIGSTAQPTTQPASGFEIRFQESASVYDGRFANLGWLQEAPDPMTKVTWDNPALISKKDADELGVGNGQMLRIRVGGRELQIAAYIMPGQPAGVIGLPLGYGRTMAGNVGTRVGFDTYRLRTSNAMTFATGAQVEKAGGSYKLALTQNHHIMDRVGFAGRAQRVGEPNQSGMIINEAPLAEYAKDPHTFHRDEHGNIRLQLFDQPRQFNTPHAWGMSIDMNSCIGCNGCVLACQAENNVPVVGKDQVLMSREMHWLRIDRYFKGSADDPSPEVVYQPMMCQHCENAPCEQVCPVAATVHDTEGLNTMVYNRCIGTRYCSNNCPYKVRRFNYFDFHAKDPRGTAKPWLGMPDTQQREAIDQLKQMVFNPEVTVRMRGVMEKCTYCVQRIKAVEIAKRNAGEPIRDGDVVTACQQACPTQAIVFGDLNDPNSRVSQLRKNNRTYEVLAELNTRTRTRYMARIRNSGVEAKSEHGEQGGHA